MREVTTILPFYCQPLMLREQFKEIRGAWSKEIQRRWHLVIVDDASPKWGFGMKLHNNDGSPTRNHPIGGTPRLVDVQALRIANDIPWNVEGARNIGVYYARTEWVLLTAIDHIVPAATAASLLDGDFDPNRVYEFPRYDYDTGAEKPPHPGSLFLTRKTWEKIGGCDERLAGVYGGAEEFRGRAVSRTGPILLAPKPLAWASQRVPKDAEAPRVQRISRENTAALKKVLAEIAKDSGPRRFTFEYKRIM